MLLKSFAVPVPVSVNTAQISGLEYSTLDIGPCSYGIILT